MSDLKPGSFFLVSVQGLAGFGIGLGQALAGAPSRYEHAGLILDADGTVLEAEPGGARIANLSEYAGRPLLVSDGPVQSWLAQQPKEVSPGVPRPVDWPLAESATRAEIVREAMNFVGIGYSPLDYVALGLLHLHLPSKWVRKRVQRSGRVICSQLVDAVFERVGIHLFDDGRLPGDVMPADLAAWAEDFAARSAS